MSRSPSVPVHLYDHINDTKHAKKVMSLSFCKLLDLRLVTD